MYLPATEVNDAIPYRSNLVHRRLYPLGLEITNALLSSAHHALLRGFIG